MGAEPVYFVDSRECAWDVLLDIPLQCDRLEPWLHTIVTDWRERKRAERARFNEEWYGQDEYDFRTFLQRLTRDPDFCWVGPEHRHMRCIQREVVLPTHTRAPGWARLLSDGRLELEIGAGAQMSGECAGVYCFGPGSTDLLAASLAVRLNVPVASPLAMMELLPAAFSSWFPLRDWAVAVGLSYQHHVSAA